MTMAKHIIFGVHVTNRLEEAGLVQRLLSEYGCNIKTRSGCTRWTRNTALRRDSAPGDVRDEKKCHELAEKLNAVKVSKFRRSFSITCRNSESSQ
jgi:hypothetical protein